MNNLTIGYIPSVKVKNGSPIGAFDVDAAVKVAQTANTKTDLPVNYVYQGLKGIYSPSNVFFIDIDTDEGVDTVIDNRDVIFGEIPFIYALQKSSSGKLHIFCIHNDTFADEDQWEYNTTLYSIVALKMLNKVVGIDYLSIEGAFDLHNASLWTQAFYFSRNPFYVNEYATAIRISSTDERGIRNDYSEYFEEKGKAYEANPADIKDVDIDFKSVAGKIRIDRNFSVGRYSGNDLRWRIGSYLTCTYGEDAAAVIVGRLFSNPEDFTYYNKGVNQLVKNWFENTFPVKKSESFIEQEKNRLTCVDMEDGKWMSDYIDIIESYVSKEQILTVSAPTGAGKTRMLEALTKKYHHNALILVPFNVTNNLYAWSNVVSSSSSNEFKPGKINTMVWDQFVMKYREIERSCDIVFVDESHTLFLDRVYRDSAVDVWGKFDVWRQAGKKIVFISATPAGEIQKTNSRVLKFVKKDTRDVKVNVITTNDTLTALESDIANRNYDKVCVFSDRDVKILYARMCVNGKHTDAKIYHSQWPKNVEELKATERLTARVNLLTCIAFNGLNIRNSGENICVSIRYTNGCTTLNEIIQIIGRFRNNHNITLNIYVDNKFISKEDLDELFANAAAITNYEGNSELKSEYYERLSKSNVQDSLREIEAYEGMWTLGNVISELKSRYPIATASRKFDKERVVKRVNPIKKQASNLMVRWLSGEMDEDAFRAEYEGTDMSEFINDWKREINDIKTSVGCGAGLVDAVMAECKKQNTLVENAIKKIKHIIWVVSMDNSQWKEEIANRDGVKSMLKGDNMVKRAAIQFKKDDNIRIKYAEYVRSNSDVDEISVVDPEELFVKVVDEINAELQDTAAKKSKAHSGPRKKHMFRCVETGESKTKPEWLSVLGCDDNRFNYLVRKKLYVKEV